MLNKILESRINHGWSRQDIINRILAVDSKAKETTLRQEICFIESGKNAHVKTKSMITRYSKAYDMTYEEFANALEFNKAHCNDPDFLNELSIFRYKKSSSNRTSKYVNGLPADTAKKSDFKTKTYYDKIRNDCINEGFYNIADRSAYNKYCQINKCIISVDDWHKIVQIKDKAFRESHNGMSENNYRNRLSKINCARKAGFGDDYNKYDRWVKYLNSHENPMSKEKWIVYDEERQKKRKMSKPIEKQAEYQYTYLSNKVIELGLTDITQYRRWHGFKRRLANKNVTLEEWKIIDAENQAKRKKLKEMREKDKIK